MAPNRKEKANTKGAGQGSNQRSSASNKTTDDNGGKVKASKLFGGKRKESQKINVRHILCERSSRKDEALHQLRMGIPFDEVATEYSEDKTTDAGGSLGWRRRGDLDPIFAAAAFELIESVIGRPVWGEAKTELGYHIMMVEGKKLA